MTFKFPVVDSGRVRILDVEYSDYLVKGERRIEVDSITSDGGEELEVPMEVLDAICSAAP